MTMRMTMTVARLDQWCSDEKLKILTSSVLRVCGRMYACVGPSRMALEKTKG